MRLEMEEVCCAECGDGLGLWFPRGKYAKSVYCEDCHTQVQAEVDECAQEKETLEDEVEEKEKEIAGLQTELQEAEIKEADREQEEPLEVET